MVDRRSMILGASALALSGCQPPPSVPERAAYLASPGAAAAGGAPRAGLLLPLTGSEAALGQALLEAARQALAEVPGDGVVLAPQDTLPDAASAARRAATLGCGLLIGPVGSRAALAATGATPLPMLALSNDTSLARAGVWPLGLDPEAQATRVASFAIGMGRARLLAVLPEDAFGARLRRGLEQAVARQPQARLLPTVTHPALGLPPTDLALLASEADAVLVGAGGRVPAAVMALLDGLVPAPRLLGTTQWLEEPDPAEVAPPPGAWIALPEPGAGRGFAARYAQRFGRTAPALSLVLADAVGVAAAVARDGGMAAELLTRPEGFAGRLGAFRLLPDGRVERLLAVAETSPGGGLQLVDPPPGGFGLA